MPGIQLNSDRINGSITKYQNDPNRKNGVNGMKTKIIILMDNLHVTLNFNLSKEKGIKRNS